MTGLELGPGVVLGVLIWAFGRIVTALIEGRSFTRRAGCLGELLHHVDSVSVATRDLLTGLESVGRDVAALRHAAEQHDRDQ